MHEFVILQLPKTSEQPKPTQPHPAKKNPDMPKERGDGASLPLAAARWEQSWLDADKLKPPLRQEQSERGNQKRTRPSWRWFSFRKRAGASFGQVGQWRKIAKRCRKYINDCKHARKIGRSTALYTS